MLAKIRKHFYIINIIKTNIVITCDRLLNKATYVISLYLNLNKKTNIYTL